MTSQGSNADTLRLVEDAPPPGQTDRDGRLRSWKLIVADDEPDVHEITQTVLSGLKVAGRSVTALSAYSGEEAIAMLRDNPDTAAILLDVVMETDEAGLDAVRRIRRELRNRFVRVILRTGQPGVAPEGRVIAEYDINDYKEKTELTSQKLQTAVSLAIRGYQDLITVERSREALEHTIHSAGRFLRARELDSLAREVLAQLPLMLGSAQGVKCESGLVAVEEAGELRVVAGAGAYAAAAGTTVADALPSEPLALVRTALETGSSLLVGPSYAGLLERKGGPLGLLLVTVDGDLPDFGRDVIQAFASHVAIAFDNVHLNAEVAEAYGSITTSQRETILTLGEVVETRSRETANHVRRVAEYTRLLAQRLGLGDDQAAALWMASPMHDVGKIGIADAILQKPGRLDDDEFEIMKQHTTIGYDILRKSSLDILATAATIALQHHERWDGKGYPQGLAGAQTDLLARIVGVIDVFDALRSARPYKDPWPWERIHDYLRMGRETQFDPQLVDALLEHFDEFKEIRDAYPDGS